MDLVNDRLVPSTIVEVLDRNGALEVEDLFKSVQKLHSELDRRFFEETLMGLEIQGLIRVYGLTRDKRRIEIVKG